MGVEKSSIDTKCKLMVYLKNHPNWKQNFNVVFLQHSRIAPTPIIYLKEPSQPLLKIDLVSLDSIPTIYFIIIVYKRCIRLYLFYTHS